MKAKHILSLIQNDMTTVAVSYKPHSTKHYTFKALKSEELKAGDFVIVPCAADETRFGFHVCRIEAVHDEPQIDTDAVYTYKWLVGKIDTTRYAGILEVEERFEAMINKLRQKQMRRQLVDSVIHEFDEGSQERKDLELLLSGNLSLEQVERMITHDGTIENTSDADSPDAAKPAASE